jgi:hypothetical protein
MRFRGSVEFWVEVSDLDQVGDVIEAAEQAARAALDQEDLGHRISGRTFRCGRDSS